MFRCAIKTGGAAFCNQDTGEECVYFKVCGSTTRTEPCKGRKTKRQSKEEAKNG